MEKQKRKKLFTRESSQQEKEEQGNLFGFYFSILQQIKLGRKTEKKQEIFLDFLKVFQTHKKKARK